MSSVYDYRKMNGYGGNVPGGNTDYAPDISRFASGASFPQRMSQPQMPFDSSSMNYGSFAGLDGFDDTATFGSSFKAPGMMDQAKSWWGDNKGMLMGDKNTPGIIPMGVGMGTNIMNTFLGMENYGLAKQSMQDARDRYASDYAAQKTVVNRQISNQEASRAGMGGMTRAEAQAYGDNRAKEIGVK